MALNIPNYTIDERLLKAIKYCNMSYISAKIRSNPRLLFTHFFHEGYISEHGLYSNIIHPPAKYILTLLGYSVLYSSNNILQFLLDKGADPNARGVIVDCPVNDPNVRWKSDLYRMHECYPVCLTLPQSKTFTILLETTYDPIKEINLRFRLVTPHNNRQRQEAVKGIWELCWIFWKPMRNPQTLIQTTNLLIDKGINIQNALIRIDLIQLLRKGFKYSEDLEIHFKETDNANLALKFIEELHFNGCQFGIMKMNEGLYKVLVILYDHFIKVEANEKCKMIENLTKAVYLMNPNFQNVILLESEKTNLPGFFKCLLSLPRLSLKALCLRRIRTLITTKNFVKRVNKLPKISEQNKSQILRGC